MQFAAGFFILRAEVILLALACVALSCHCGCNDGGEKGMEFEFCDASLPARVRAEKLVALMTLDEKIQQLSTYSFTTDSHTPGIPRLNVSAYNYHSEGLHGIRTSSVEGIYATLYPQVTGMAATGNLSRIREMASIMGVELRTVANAARNRGDIFGKGGGLSIYGPTINIIRDPRWGRGQESVSEDPWLNGAYGYNFITGIQGDEGAKYLLAAATCKHLVAYSREKDRLLPQSNIEVSDLDMHETYLRAFRVCVAANPSQVMCAYNGINDVPACLRGDIQNGILRGEWNWNGSIVSDCDAIKDAAAFESVGGDAEAVGMGLQAGCDQDCGIWYSKYAQEALKRKLVNETTIDTALARTFTMRFRLGEFDANVPFRNLNASLTSEHLSSSLNAARESITLLKNSDGVLPFSKQESVAIIGPLGNSTMVMMGAKDDYYTDHIISILEGFESAAADKGSVRYSNAGLKSVTSTSTSGFRGAVSTALKADKVVLVMGIDKTVEAETRDRTSTDLPGAQMALIEQIVAAKGPNHVAVCLVNGGSVSIDAWASNVSAIVEIYEPGMFAGKVVAEIVYGDTNPSGMLPYQIYPSSYAHQMDMKDFEMRPNATKGSLGRTYRFFQNPTIDFGYGLSYSEFFISWIQKPATPCTRHALGLKLPLSVRIGVSKHSSFPGATTVQLYVRKLSDANAPLRQLVGLKKTAVLQPGDSEIVNFELSSSDDPITRAFCPFCSFATNGTREITRGKYEVIVSLGKGEEYTVSAIVEAT